MAKKRYPKSEAIQNAEFINQEAYVTWGDDLTSKVDALNKSSQSLDEYSGIQHSSASPYLRNDFSNILPNNISGKPGLSRSDYDYFRPQESVPNQIKDILKRADTIYQRIGLVKNVIDLMGDFSSQGIRIVHPNKRIERFYRNWFKKVRGKDRSERFLNNIYRTGNVVITRQTAKLGVKTETKMYKTTAADFNEQSLQDEEINLARKEIPWKYTFIDPFFVDIAAGALSSFVQKKVYSLVLPANIRKIINAPKNEQEQLIVSKLPAEIIEAAKTKKPYMLDSNKTMVFHYKKDDWQIWAYPMIYAIMDDITVLEKLKLADMAALDGAISNIRIFKLGNLEHKIAPTKAAASKLASILQNNVGGGTMDIVWGPDIELLESNTNVHQFLGEGKYTPHLNNVYAGLGIPPTLTGTFGAAGTTNNFISLKTLTQRLQYGRDVLVQFWDNEITLVQKAMGFRYPAKIEFDRMDLSNEETEKALLIQLADRNVISDEFLQKRFGADPEMERVRLNRESNDRSAERMVPKMGPYNNLENDMKKIALQLGLATPSEVGLDLMEKQKGQKTLLEIRNELDIKKAIEAPKSNPFGGSNTSPGRPGQGRPQSQKDSTKRKTKQFAPQTGASLILSANKLQEKINNTVNPILLNFYKKKNMRSLSDQEYIEAEIFKSKLLFSMSPQDKHNDETIIKNIESINSINPIYSQYNKFITNLEKSIGKELSIEENKQAKAYFYSLVYSQS
jgi:hypothetical protein